MTLYTVAFSIPPQTTDADTPYKRSVIAEDASEAFNKAFQMLVDQYEAAYPDRAVRPAPKLTIKNHATGQYELPDPVRIQAYQQTHHANGTVN